MERRTGSVGVPGRGGEEAGSAVYVIVGDRSMRGGEKGIEVLLLLATLGE